MQSLSEALVHEPDPPDPQPLFRKPIPPAPFPIEALTSILQDAVCAIVDKTKAPMEIAANSVLAVAHLCTQHIANVSVAGMDHPNSNFFVTIAKSGERKSTVDALALRAVREFEKQESIEYETKYDEYKAEKEAHEAVKKQITSSKNRKKSQADIADELMELTEPRPPRRPIIVFENPTFEGLCKLYEIGRPSVGIFRRREVSSSVGTPCKMQRNGFRLADTLASGTMAPLTGLERLMERPNSSAEG